MAGTRWVRLDVDYFLNPKATAAGRDGRALHLASICWSHAQLTNGHVPAAVVPVLLQVAGVPRSAIDQVLGAGLWVTNGVGFEIHDFVEMNGSRDDVERERERWRDRQRRYRESRRESP